MIEGVLVVTLSGVRVRPELSGDNFPGRGGILNHIVFRFLKIPCPLSIWIMRQPSQVSVAGALRIFFLLSGFSAAVCLHMNVQFVPIYFGRLYFFSAVGMYHLKT